MWVLALVGGLLAGAAAWLADEPIHAHFQAPMRQVVTMGYASLRTTKPDMIAASIKNSAVAYGLLGGLLGGWLGVAGGLAHRNGRAAVVAGVVGLVSGAALTALVAIPALAGYWAYFGDSELSEELLVPLLTHASTWGAIGLTGGLALALGLGGGRSLVIRVALGGLFGAIIGTVVYEFLGAALLPLDKTTFPISASLASRGLARMSVTLGTLLGVLSSVGAERSRPSQTGVEKPGVSQNLGTGPGG